MTIEQLDNEIISVLEYLTTHKYGYMRDLEKLGKNDIIDGLKVLGMVKTGYTRDGETYAITRQGIAYYNIVRPDKKSLFAKIFHRIKQR